jgi:hypothetical protein
VVVLVVVVLDVDVVLVVVDVVDEVDVVDVVVDGMDVDVVVVDVVGAIVVASAPTIVLVTVVAGASVVPRDCTVELHAGSATAANIRSTIDRRPTTERTVVPHRRRTTAPRRAHTGGFGGCRRGNPGPMPTAIAIAELDRLLASGAQLVEVLPAKSFKEEHLPDAISIPLKEIDETTIASLDPRRAVVTYCWDAL